MYNDFFDLKKNNLNSKHSTESRFVVRPENIVCRCVQALFSPEILQAGAVKGLILSFFVFPLCAHTLLGQRPFSNAAPSVWNRLPYKVRSSDMLTSFESALKSHLF